MYSILCYMLHRIMYYSILYSVIQTHMHNRWFIYFMLPLYATSHNVLFNTTFNNTNIWILCISCCRYMQHRIVYYSILYSVIQTHMYNRWFIYFILPLYIASHNVLFDTTSNNTNLCIRQMITCTPSTQYFACTLISPPARAVLLDGSGWGWFELVHKVT